MKIYSIFLYKNNKVVDKYLDVSEAYFFYRNSLRDFLEFGSDVIIKRIGKNKLESIVYEDKLSYAYKTKDIGVVVITSIDYVKRIIGNLILDIMEDGKINLEKVEKYKNPKENDLILKTKKELDQTVTEMHKTIGQILDRGEKIDNLIEKSSNLNYQSKLFYKKSKKLNDCCSLI